MVTYHDLWRLLWYTVGVYPLVAFILLLAILCLPRPLRNSWGTAIAGGLAILLSFLAGIIIGLRRKER